MKEKNRKTLEDALNNLPRFGPQDQSGADAGAGLWDKIEQGLDRPNLAEVLPEYTPPAEVWNGLSAKLRTEQVAAEPTPASGATIRPLAGATTTNRSRNLFRFAAVAAAVALFLSVGLGLLTGGDTSPDPTVTYAYSQEAAPARMVADWDDGEESFDRALAQIDARNEPTLNTLRHELDELTAAKEEIKAMLVAYGEDPGIVRQMAEIERDRSEVYRRIINEL